MLLKQRLTCYLQSGFMCVFWSRKGRVGLVDFRSLSCFWELTSNWTLGISFFKCRLAAHHQGKFSDLWSWVTPYFALLFTFSSPFFLGANFLYKALWSTPCLFLVDFQDLRQWLSNVLAMTHSKKHLLYHDSEHSYNTYYHWCTRSYIV